MSSETYTRLTVVVVTVTYIPEIRKIVEAMGNGLKFGYAMSAKLFIESKIVRYLSNMKCAGECVVAGLVSD